MSQQIEVTMLTPADAHDATLIDAIADFVNSVYEIAEDGMWRAGATRTSASEIKTFVAAGEIAVASLGGQPGTSHPPW